MINTNAFLQLISSLTTILKILVNWKIYLMVCKYFIYELLKIWICFEGKIVVYNVKSTSWFFGIFRVQHYIFGSKEANSESLYQNSLFHTGTELFQNKNGAFFIQTTLLLAKLVLSLREKNAFVLFSLKSPFYRCLSRSVHFYETAWCRVVKLLVLYFPL